MDKLTGLIAIFQRPEFDFKNNKAGGDDILGDAYEYLTPLNLSVTYLTNSRVSI